MRISFDFDGTLVDEFGGHPSNSQKDEIQGLAKKYLSEGHEVMIITKRFGPENADKGIIRYQKVIDDANNRAEEAINEALLLKEQTINSFSILYPR